MIEDLKNAIQNNQVSTLERINSFNEDLVTTRMVVNERFEALNTIKETLREELGREFRNSSDDAAQKLEVLINQASERIVSTIIDNFKDGLSAGNAEEGQISKLSDNVTGRLDDIINRIEQKADNTYSMADLEADLAKMRLSLEKSSKNIGADFQNIGGWLRNTNARLKTFQRLWMLYPKRLSTRKNLV